MFIYPGQKTVEPGEVLRVNVVVRHTVSSAHITAYVKMVKAVLEAVEIVDIHE